MTRYRMLATASVWAALLAGCGTLKTRTDALDLLRRCTSKQGPSTAIVEPSRFGRIAKPRLAVRSA